MKISAKNLGISTVISTGLLWVICSILIHFFSSSMISMTGHMIHMDMSSVTWTLTFSGFFIGLFGWMGIAGFTAYLIAFIYNILVN